MKQFNNLHFTGPIRSWDEGIPLGNGALGCLVWGRLKNLRFSMDKAGLWDLTPAPQTQLPDFTYQTMVKLVRERDRDGLNALFDAPYANATPTKLPLGAFELEGLREEPYQAEFSLSEATARLASKSVKIQIWLAATDPLLVVDVFSKNPVRFRPMPPEYSGTDNDPEDPLCRRLSDLGYPPPRIVSDGVYQGFVQEISDGRSYCVLCRSSQEDGHTRLLVTVDFGMKPDAVYGACRNRLAVQAEQMLCALRQNHLDWWENFWQQSSVSLPDTVLEQLWYRGNYFLGAASRLGEAPMPLQGVWTADQNALPPWKGDYHNDLNTQFTYCGYLTANHLPQGKAFLEYLWQLLPQAKKFAANFYGTPGACYPGVMALDGNPLGGWPMYSLSPTNTIWLCQLFYEHYRITGDQVFLKNRVWPMFVACEQCVGALLLPGPDGKLVLPLSSSPEIYDDALEAWLKPNSNYDLALLRYLYETLLAMARELGEPDTRWQNRLNALADLAVEPESGLMYDQNNQVRESHRHFSHAMAIYPLRQLTGKEAGERQTIRRTIARLESLGTSQWVGFSFPWYALLKIIEKDGEGANQALQDFAIGFLSPNGFHLNGDYHNLGLSNFHYRPFTLEANMLAVQAVSEMLLYSQGGELEIFPAIPKDWNAIAFSGLRGECGLLISAEKEENTITLQLEAKHHGSWYLRNTGEQITLRPGEKKTILWRNL